MLAEYGTFSLQQVLGPAMQMAAGYPIEASEADNIESEKERIKEWPYSQKTLLPHLGDEEREAPHPGELFHQPDLLETLQKLVEAEQQALKAGKDRKAAIYAAYDRFYRGDIAKEFVRGSREQGALRGSTDISIRTADLTDAVPPSVHNSGAGMLTCYPSSTPFGLD